ncbi:PREDICTED: 39S ribosomal protein L30, mitochondrial [Vollenhovia emeryi]|uniref:39S ribosomal protein L30, mitochondrial n=1 Tax=Vollenhovia emeryi TaxID=411798 RepID=UPI0005F44802|nr:PREDICTED: 39S ribosomal protein L30, mitochondrial [Vollenhovia emeryi]
MLARGMATRLTCTPALLNFTRPMSAFKTRKVKWKYVADNPEAVRYEGVTYFPRHPDHVDPPFEPSKLLLVKRVKRFSGNPWWDKEVLKCLGFVDEKHVNDPVIVKNTPEICAMLWKVKHLVKIVPIKLPDKMPTADDLNGTYLHENGTFYVVPRIDPAREEAIIKFVNDPKKLNRDLIQEKLRLSWLNGHLM